jgi:hypothetical protein
MVEQSEGLVPVLNSGEAQGRIALRSRGWMQPTDVLRLHPEMRAQLDDIAKQGWSYLFIETVGTVEAEVVLGASTFRMTSRSPPGTYRSERLRYFLELELGEKTPTITGVPEISEFKVNVCSKSFPRAATVDLSKGLVTYIDDHFWKWEKGWEGDKKKLSDAKEVKEIASWLIDVKGYKLDEPFKLERYQELKDIFEAARHPLLH